jgi:acyl-CoA dehydrogenase
VTAIVDFSHSARAQEYIGRVGDFIRHEIEPVEADYHRAVRAAADPWEPLPLIAELQGKARAAGLWNLFMPDETYGVGLTNVEYAPLAELMGRSFIAPHAFNCNAPDTGNMEVLAAYGSSAQRDAWLTPLLEGRIRSAFCMTEPDVASSDATNMQATVAPDGDSIVVNGRKWWSTGMGHPACELLIVMGLSEPQRPRHSRHTMVLVPRSTPGVTVERMLPTMGIYDEPFGHGQVRFDDVRVPAENVVVGLGRGFEIAQRRLGPGRVHHCMRLVGLAERALALACTRVSSRTAFGQSLSDLGANRERIADARIAIEQVRLLVLKTAWLLDSFGLPGARSEVSQIKVAAPRVAQDVIDMAIQMHGGAGLSDDFPLAAAWASARSLRLADGPDEVHRGVVASVELAAYQVASAKAGEGSR